VESVTESRLDFTPWAGGSRRLNATNAGVRRPIPETWTARSTRTTYGKWQLLETRDAEYDQGGSAKEALESQTVFSALFRAGRRYWPARSQALAKIQPALSH